MYLKKDERGSRSNIRIALEEGGEDAVAFGDMSLSG